MVLGPPFIDRKSLGTKQTEDKPNANRGWSIKLVNYIQPQLNRLCQKSSWTPTSQNADEAPPYWGFQRYDHLAHDDVIKWKLFPCYWPFVRGIQRWPVDSLPKGQWRGAFLISLMCAWTNGLENSRDSGDLRRLAAHCDVIVMECYPCYSVSWQRSRWIIYICKTFNV